VQNNEGAGRIEAEDAIKRLGSGLVGFGGKMSCVAQIIVCVRLGSGRLKALCEAHIALKQSYSRSNITMEKDSLGMLSAPI
jgi:hypothetical protein